MTYRTHRSNGTFPIRGAHYLLLAGLAFVSLGAKEYPCRPPSVVLAGTLRYDGQPMSEITENEPHIWFRDESTGQAYPDATAEYSPEDGSYQVTGLPGGPMGMAISFHVTGDQPTLPGNYRIFHRLDLSTIPRKERCAHDIDLWQIMHLTEPWDNSLVEFPIGHGDDTYPTHPSPLTFAWDPLPAASSYELRLSEKRNPDHPDGYGHIRWVLNEESAATPFTGDLEASAPGTHYELELYARDADGDRVGQIMTTYTNGHGWDYRFRVEAERP